MSSHFKEQDNTSDTVSLVTSTSSVLTVGLANSGQTYDLDDQNNLDLELKSKKSTLTLVFGYGDSWPRTASATVALDSGDAQSVPCTFAAVPTGSSLHITITIESQRLITWDPKIKVVAPTRTTPDDQP